MRGITRAPFVAFLGILVVAAMLGGRAAADELINSNDLSDDAGLYMPQAAPADQALDLTPEELYPVAPAPEVVLKSPARRTPRAAAISSRRVTAALTLLLAVQLNSPRFKASLGSIPQAGSTLSALPGVAVASATRIQGAVPKRRHLTARRVPPSRPSPGAKSDPTLTALFLPEDVLLH